MSSRYGDHACTGCFLLERSGGVCPAARAAYGLETSAEVRQRAEALRVAIAEDAHAGHGLLELIRRDAYRQPLTAQLPMSAATSPSHSSADALDNETSKEAINVVSSRPRR